MPNQAMQLFPDITISGHMPTSSVFKLVLSSNRQLNNAFTTNQETLIGKILAGKEYQRIATTHVSQKLCNWLQTESVTCILVILFNIT